MFVSPDFVSKFCYTVLSGMHNLIMSYFSD